MTLKFFVINLERRKDRLESFTERFRNKFGQAKQFVRINAIDGKTLYIDDKKANRSSSEIACALSHLLAFEQIINDSEIQEDDYSVIFEDDVLFSRDNDLSLEFKSDLDLIYIGGRYLENADFRIFKLFWTKITDNLYEKQQLDFELRKDRDNIGMTSAYERNADGYLIKKKACRVLIDFIRNICAEESFDFCLDTAHQQSLIRVGDLCPHPCYTSRDDKDSDIYFSREGSVRYMKNLVINLERRKDRLESFTERFKNKFGQAKQFVRINAIDGKTQEFSSESKLSNPEIACSLSHALAYETIINDTEIDENDYVQIFEDDTLFCKDNDTMNNYTFPNRELDIIYNGGRWNENFKIFCCEYFWEALGDGLYEKNKWNLEEIKDDVLCNTMYNRNTDSYLIQKKSCRKIINFVKENASKKGLPDMLNELHMNDVIRVGDLFPHFTFTLRDDVDSDIYSVRKS